MSIYVNSLGFDGCVLNGGVHTSLHRSACNRPLSFDDIMFDFFENNEKLYSAVLSQMSADNFDKMIVLVGSSRQSYAVDQDRKAMSGYACFQVINALSTLFCATFDPFLLADIYGNLPSGSAFQQAMSQEHSEARKNHADCVVDHTKVSILYAQMHKVASEHPETDIEFNFFDDRNDIHEALINFYLNAIDLIPKGVTLKLHLYNGAQLENLCEMKGNGIIDRHYRQSVKEMYKQIQRGTDAYRNECNIANELNVDKFREWKDISVSTYKSSFENSILSLEHMSQNTYLAALKLIESTLTTEHKEQSLLISYFEQALEIGTEYYYNYAPAYNETVNLVRDEYNMAHSKSNEEWGLYRAKMDATMHKLRKILDEIHLHKDPVILTKLDERRHSYFHDVLQNKTTMELRLHLQDFKPRLPFRDDYSSKPIDYHSYNVALQLLKVALHLYNFKLPQHKEIVIEFIDSCILQAEWLEEHLNYSGLLQLIVEKLEIQLGQFFSAKLPIEWIDAGNNRLLQCQEEIDGLVNFLQHSLLQKPPQDVNITRIEQHGNNLLFNQSMFQPAKPVSTYVDPDRAYEEAYVEPGLTYSSTEFY